MRPWGTQGIKALAGLELCGRAVSMPCRKWSREPNRDLGCTPPSFGTHSTLLGTLLHALSESFQCLRELRFGATPGLSPSVTQSVSEGGCKNTHCPGLGPEVYGCCHFTSYLWHWLGSSTASIHSVTVALLSGGTLVLYAHAHLSSVPGLLLDVDVLILDGVGGRAECPL